MDDKDIYQEVIEEEEKKANDPGRSDKARARAAGRVIRLRAKLDSMK